MDFISDTHCGLSTIRYIENNNAILENEYIAKDNFNVWSDLKKNKIYQIGFNFDDSNLSHHFIIDMRKKILIQSWVNIFTACFWLGDEKLKIKDEKILNSRNKYGFMEPLNEDYVKIFNELFNYIQIKRGREKIENIDKSMKKFEETGEWEVIYEEVDTYEFKIDGAIWKKYILETSGIELEIDDDKQYEVNINIKEYYIQNNIKNNDLKGGFNYKNKYLYLKIKNMI